MKYIFKLIKKYKIQAILSPLFKLVEAAFELCIPLVIASLVDNGIKLGDTNHIIKMSILLVVLPFLGLLFSITAQYFAAVVAMNTSKNMRHDLFDKIQSLSYTEYDRLGTSKLITILTSDVNQVQTGVNLALRLLLRSPIVVLGSTIMALFVSVKLGLIFLIVTAILSIVIYIIMKTTIPMYSKVQTDLDKVLKSSRENLTGVRVIRSFNNQAKEEEQFRNIATNLTSSQIKVGKISALLNPITYVLINIAIICLLYFGGIEVNIGNLTQGKVIALYNYMSLFLVELIKFANLLITINKSIASSKRINQIINMDSSLQSNNNDATNNNGIVVFDNVTFFYKDASLASLKNISFTVKKGETIGIIGSTGSGKTSLINLIGHFYDTTNGTVYVDGKDVKSYDNEALRNKIGYVLQKAVLFKGTIKSNLLWGNKNASDEDIYNAVKIAQVDEILKTKEKGINSKVENNGKNFSGGQRQRITIARALVKKPEILILDDATSALDYATDAKIRKALHDIDYEMTTFIVSQRTTSIKHANKIIVLENGEMVGLGTHDELLKNCPTYQEIHATCVNMEEENEK